MLSRSADLLVQAAFGRLLGGGAAGDFGLPANLLGLLMGLLHDLRGLAADRFKVLIGPVVHVLEVERDRLHRPAGAAAVGDRALRMIVAMVSTMRIERA